MRVHVLSIGDESTASTHFRFLQYTELLRERGIELVLHARATVGPELFRRLQGEVVVLQKILLSRRQLRLLERCARRLVFDFDDAIWTRPGRPFSPPTRWRVRRRLRRCLRAADAVTVASEYLAAYARRHTTRCERIPMAIDCGAWQPRLGAQRDNVVVGWTGSPVNLPFLDAVAPALRRLLDERNDVEVRIYCGRRPELPFPFRYQEYAPGTEAAFVRELDVGLCPLEDHEFARGKSPIKILQYLACGVPVVASKVGASSELLEPAWSPVENGAGWYEALAELTADPAGRAAMAAAGRQYVDSTHDLGVVAERLQGVLVG
ncbi:MAG: glycosyltransferase [Planctomycetota bacterium]|nr:glycosyltransferase [Planctomycetota bacterium]